MTKLSAVLLVVFLGTLCNCDYCDPPDPLVTAQLAASEDPLPAS